MSVTATARQGGSWSDGSNNFQIWDINVTNTGTCALSQFSAAVTVGSGSVVTQSWNYDLASNVFSDFGLILYPQESFVGAGIIVTGGAAPSFSSLAPQCDSSCASAGSGSSSGSGSGSGSASSSSSGSSASGSTPIDTNCQLSVSQTRRTGSGAAWISGGYAYQLYDLGFYNSGSETVIFAELDQSFGVGQVASVWNMVQVCCTQIDSAASYNVTLPAGGLVPRASTNAGIILQYLPNQALQDPEFLNPIVQTATFNHISCLQA